MHAMIPLSALPRRDRFHTGNQHHRLHNIAHDNQCLLVATAEAGCSVFSMPDAQPCPTVSHYPLAAASPASEQRTIHTCSNPWLPLPRGAVTGGAWSSAHPSLQVWSTLSQSQRDHRRKHLLGFWFATKSSLFCGIGSANASMKHGRPRLRQGKLLPRTRKQGREENPNDAPPCAQA